MNFHGLRRLATSAALSQRIQSLSSQLARDELSNGPRHPILLPTLKSLSLSLARTGSDHERVTELLLRIVEMERDEAELPAVHAALGKSYLDRGMPKLSIPWYEKALAAVNPFGEEMPLIKSRVLFGLGRALSLSGSKDLALGPLQESLEIARIHAPLEASTAETMVALAEALSGVDRGEQANELLGEASAIVGEPEPGQEQQERGPNKIARRVRQMIEELKEQRRAEGVRVA